MAEVRISELDEATSIAGTELVPVVQGGVTKRVASSLLKGQQGDPGPQGEQGPQGETGPAGTTTWEGIIDKPATFAPSAHTHPTSEITGLDAALGDKEPVVTSGTTAQFWRGDKTWQDLFTQVRAAVLTGLSTATSTVVAATDTVLVALGKLQAQVTSHTGNTSNPHAVTKAQVGLGNVDNTSNATERAATATLTNKTLTTPVINGFTGSTAEINIGSGQIIKDVSGNLQVNNQLRVAVASGNAQVKLERTSTSAGVGYIGANSASALSVMNSSFTELMQVTQGGNVGVGGTPTQKLDVIDSGDVNVSSRVRNATGIFDIYALAGGNIALLSQSAGKSLSLGTVGVTRQTITADGNVGIGTTGTLGYKLAVALNDSSKKVLFSSDVSSGFVYSNGNLFIGTNNADVVGFVTNNAERATLDGNGNLLLKAGALGYGVGAGGTATQVTSKGQAVVMATAKPSGRITMHGASLAAGASIEFGFTNSMLAAADGIVVRPDAFTGYAVEVAYFNSATEVVLRVTNKGATRSDALGIIFQIIKGSTT